MYTHRSNVETEDLSETLKRGLVRALPYVFSVVIALAGGYVLSKSTERFGREIIEKAQVESQR